MATLTPNYNLVKPAQEDFYNVDDQNRNMDTIDKTMKALADDLTKRASLGPDGKVQPDQLPAGSDPSEAIRSAVDTHNSNEGAHKDIRDEVAAAAKAAQTAQESADAALEAVSGLVYTIDVVPSQNGTLTFNGSPQSPSWNSYNPESLTLSGTTSGTNAGDYQATFTPKGKYKWTDGTQNPKQVTWKIDRASMAVPAQSGSLTYTGEAQSPTWTGYDSGKMTLGGTTTGTNAGSYNATFTPGANYKWTDGATTAKTVAWTIGKAAGSLSLSKASMSLNASKMSDTIAVTRAGNGTISAVSNAPDVASVSVSGNTVTVTAKGKGSATITVSVAADTNYTAPASKTCSVNVALPTSTLNNNDWDTISQASAAGKAASYWKVGDEKNISVNGETLTLVIVGFNHDDLAGGGKAGITFGLKHLMKDQRQMNSSNTNSGGFTGSAMYSWLQNTLLKQLPSDLQSVLKSVNKKTSAGSASSTINTNAMKLFLFSEQEIFGSKTYSTGNEGTQYPYFATAGNRIKHLANGTGAAIWWWERSPRASGSNGFGGVDSSGDADDGNAGGSGGVCFGFCV